MSNSQDQRRPIQLPHGTLVPALLLMVMLAVSITGHFREHSEGQLDAAANRAIAAFAVARTINGVISVIQEMQVGVSLGINTTLQPGQILDPLNDLIERFSTAALIAATVLWALKLLGGFVILPWLPLLLLVLLAIRIGLAGRGPPSELAQLLMRAVRAGILVWGFAALTPWVIAGVHASDGIQIHYQQATDAMESAGDQLGGLASIDSPWDIDRDSLGDSMQELTTMADRLSTQAIVVLAVFVFEVLLVPLLVFWIGSRLILNPRPN